MSDCCSTVQLNFCFEQAIADDVRSYISENGWIGLGMAEEECQSSIGAGRYGEMSHGPQPGPNHQAVSVYF